jgi:uncharacterized damage-inducible protein DinB
MQTAWIAAIIARDLRALRRELEAFPDERDLWRRPPGVLNSAGTLALHLCGNLQYYVGAKLGGTGYGRDRDAEFTTRDVSRARLLELIDATIDVVERTLGGLRDLNLVRQFPEPVAKRSVLTGDFLIHLASHLAYHLGQVDYHRRLVTGSGHSAGAVAIAELASARPVEG